MRLLRDVSVKKKLWFIALLTCVVALGLACAILLTYEIHAFRNSLVKDLAAQAQVLSSLSTAALTFNDRATAGEMLSELRSQPNIEEAILFRSGGIFATFVRDVHAPPSQLREPARDGHEFIANHVVLFRKIFFKGERVGTIFLRSNTEELQLRLAQSVITFASVFLVSALLALLLASRLHTVILDPVSRLSEAARAVAEKQDYSVRVERLGRDELGGLTEAFNQMLSRIEAQDVAIKESGERYEVAVLGSSDGLWDIDLLGRTAYYSPRCLTMLGYDADESANDLEAWAELLHPDDREAAHRIRQEYLAGKRPSYEAEVRMLHKDGSYRWILIRGAALQDGAGIPYRMAGSHSDITERKRAENALQESEVRFRSLVESASDGVIQLDADGSILSWNKGAETSFGFTPYEVLGTEFEVLLAERSREAHREILKRIMRGNAETSGKPVELVGLRQDGTEFPMEISLYAWNSGRTRFVGAIVRDITERKQTAQKLEELNHRLVEASRQAGMAEVATTVLHNVGNVLNSINVSTNIVRDLLRQSKLPNLTKAADLLRQHSTNYVKFFTEHPKGQVLPSYLISLAEYLRIEQQDSEKELESLAQNVGHVKEIVAMQQSFATVSGCLEPLQPSEMAEEALQINSDAYARHQIEVQREFVSVGNVLVDRHKVLQILVNLLSNAKYAVDGLAPGQRRVVVAIRPGAGGRAEIQVSDNGMGIAPDKLTRIFQHGFTTRSSGHGFGLHSGANAARELGGNLSVRSDGEGRGATFVLELPLAPTQSERAA